MMKQQDVILKVENVSKQYRLGFVGTGTISHDLNRFFAKIRGKEDPYLKIGESNDRSTKGTSEYVWALKDINFEVKRGEVLGIIGKNGAGKSTLLKILSKVTGPTTGCIKYNGRIASLLEVGTGFHPEMTGKENIFLNGAILGMTKKEISRKLDEIIDFSGCERYVDTPVKRYSSGMKVRLAFAVAAFLEPDILVVDEVLAVGDAEFQKKAIGKMRDISSQAGRTVLFVSHDMTAIKSLSSKTIVLVDGELGYVGKTIDAIEFYLKNNRSKEKIFLVRNEDKELYVKNIYINENNLIVTNIYSGKELKLKFELNKAISELEAKSISFYVVIKNNLNAPIFTISNRFDNGYKVEKQENRFLICNIPSLTLSEGNYSGTTWFSYKNGFSDAILNAFEINIISSDYYNTGQMPLAFKHGHFLIKQNWNAGN
jgi:lipopolysaccharide transport system ATP-binding protein